MMTMERGLGGGRRPDGVEPAGRLGVAHCRFDSRGMGGGWPISMLACDRARGGPVRSRLRTCAARRCCSPRTARRRASRASPRRPACSSPSPLRRPRESGSRATRSAPGRRRERGARGRRLSASAASSATTRGRSAGSDAPDGTYALARWDADVVELVSDVCASRTLWYTMTDDAFLASTSQRALVAVLGSFVLDEAAVSWALSAGTLGPEVSWDARLRRVPPDARVILDRATWRVDVRETPAVFEPQAGEPAIHVARLRAAIEDTCCGARPGARALGPALSPAASTPGCSSRCLSTAACGRAASPGRRAPRSGSRSRIRRSPACSPATTGSSTSYSSWTTRPVTSAPPSTASSPPMRAQRRDRRLPGRLRHVAPAAAAGVEGVVRGDEPFGDRRAPSDLPHALVRSSGSMATDYPEGHLVRSLGLAPQSRPERARAPPRRGLAALPGAAHADGLRADDAVRPERPQGALRGDRQSVVVTTDRRRDAPPVVGDAGRERTFLASWAR